MKAFKWRMIWRRLKKKRRAERKIRFQNENLYKIIETTYEKEKERWLLFDIFFIFCFKFLLIYFEEDFFYFS